MTALGGITRFLYPPGRSEGRGPLALHRPACSIKPLQERRCPDP